MVAVSRNWQQHSVVLKFYDFHAGRAAMPEMGSSDIRSSAGLMAFKVAVAEEADLAEIATLSNTVKHAEMYDYRLARLRIAYNRRLRPTLQDR